MVRKLVLSLLLVLVLGGAQLQDTCTIMVSNNRHGICWRQSSAVPLPRR